MFGRLMNYWKALPKFDEEIKPQFSLGNMLRAFTWLGLWAGALLIPDDLIADVPRYPTWIIGIFGVTYSLFVVFAPLVAVFALLGKTRKGLLFCLGAAILFVIGYCAVGYVMQFI